MPLNKETKKTLFDLKIKDLFEKEKNPCMWFFIPQIHLSSVRKQKKTNLRGIHFNSLEYDV